MGHFAARYSAEARGKTGMTNIALFCKKSLETPYRDSGEPNRVYGDSETDRPLAAMLFDSLTCFCNQDAAPFFICCWM